MPAHRVAAAAAVLLTAAALSAAADWPQWRGPNRDGVSTETGLLESWPTGGPKLAWKTDLGGVGYSSPSIADGKIYITAAEDPEKGTKEFALCLDEKTGKQLWKVYTPVGDKGYGDLSRGNGPRGSVTVDGDLLYSIGARGNLVCLKAADGQQVWAADLVKDFGGNPAAWGYSESPLVDGPKVICTPGGSKGGMVALDKKTGKPVWQSTELKDPAVYCSAIAADIGGVRQYITQTQKAAVGVRAADGKLLWRVDEMKRATAVIPTPVVYKNRAFFSAGYGAGCELLQLEPDGAGGTKATVVYTRNPVMSNHHGGIVRLGQYVYGHGNGSRWVCLDLESGDKEPVSEFKFDKGAVTAADGHLYLYSERDGTCVLVEPSPTDWKEKGRFKIPERTTLTRGGQVWTHPVVANGKLYLRDHNLLFSYNVAAK